VISINFLGTPKIAMSRQEVELLPRPEQVHDHPSRAFAIAIPVYNIHAVFTRGIAY